MTRSESVATIAVATAMLARVEAALQPSFDTDDNTIAMSELRRAITHAGAAHAILDEAQGGSSIGGAVQIGVCHPVVVVVDWPVVTVPCP